MNGIKEDLKEAQKVLSEFIGNTENLESIEKAGALMIRSLQAGNKIISCGNGGSLCDAMHFSEELTGRFRESRRPLPAVAVSDPSYLTCTANDFGFEQVFSRYIEAIGRPGDVLLAISSSGNSMNVKLAVQVAKEKGMWVVALTGKSGGAIASLCDVEIRAPKSTFSDRAQEIHIKVIHALVHYIERHVGHI